MASRRNDRRRACDGKKRLIELVAVRVAREMSRRHGEHIRAYHCRYCGHWHVGHVGKAFR